MKIYKFATFAVLAISVCTSPTLAAKKGCETSKNMHDGGGDPIPFMDQSFFGLFNKPPANTFVPVIFSTLNGFNLEDRFQARSSLEDCKAVIALCGGKFLKEPNIHAYCVKANTKRNVESVIQLK
jgi:hypothetical protein